MFGQAEAPARSVLQSWGTGHYRVLSGGQLASACSKRQLLGPAPQSTTGSTSTAFHVGLHRHQAQQAVSYASAPVAAEEQSESEAEDADSTVAEHQTSPEQNIVSSSSNSPPDSEWLLLLDQLKAYKQQYGDCLVPRCVVGLTASCSPSPVRETCVHAYEQIAHTMPDRLVTWSAMVLLGISVVLRCVRLASI